jgi:hypothetical protein
MMVTIRTLVRWRNFETRGYHEPGEVVTLSKERADILVAGGCAEILPEPTKRGRPPKTKAARPSEDK